MSDKDKKSLLAKRADKPTTRSSVSSGVEVAYRTNSRGLIEGYDKKTGQVLVVQASHYDLLEDSRQLVEATRSDGTKVMVERGIGIGSLDSEKRKESIVSLSLAMEKYVTGLPLVDSLESVGLRYSDLCYMKKMSEEASKMYEDAKRDRAEYLYNETLEKAKTSGNDRLVVDAMKWSVEKGDPGKFGNKTTVSGDSNNPVQIVIDTGIRRDGDEGYRDVSDEIDVSPRDASDVEDVDDDTKEDIFGTETES